MSGKFWALICRFLSILKFWPYLRGFKNYYVSKFLLCPVSLFLEVLEPRFLYDSGSAWSRESLDTYFVHFWAFRFFVLWGYGLCFRYFLELLSFLICWSYRYVWYLIFSGFLCTFRKYILCLCLEYPNLSFRHVFMIFERKILKKSWKNVCIFFVFRVFDPNFSGGLADQKCSYKNFIWLKNLFWFLFYKSWSAHEETQISRLFTEFLEVF